MSNSDKHSIWTWTDYVIQGTQDKLPLPRPPSFKIFKGQLGSYQPSDISGESGQAGPRLWPSRGIQGVNPDKLVAEGESAGGEWGCASHLGV